MKPKDWLKANGHISEIKRGRMSREHIELIKAAVATGVKIEGYGEVTATADKPATVERTAVDPNRLVDVPDVYRDERTLMAYRTQDGKQIEIGMRTVDNNCGSSLTYCRCDSPRVWVDHESQAVVNFKPRPEKR